MIVMYNPTHVTSITDPMVIAVKKLIVDSGYSLEKKVTQLIHMNP